MPWFRGNPHTHTTRSDGDSDLDAVVAWYAARGYDWLAITDHRRGLARAEAERLTREHGILIIPGNEFNLDGTAAHVVGLGVTDDFDKEPYGKVADAARALQLCVDAVRERGGLPILAHPNWRYAWGADELARIRDCNLFEVHNGGTDCNTFAAGGMPGTDDIWDRALDAGLRIYGLGCDDAHKFKPETFHVGHHSAAGGEAWTCVECEECDERRILAAMEAGRVVASSGPAPVEAGVRDGEYVVRVTDPYEYTRFTTTFFGPDGVLGREHGREVACRLEGKDGWIRARVYCSSGRYLWTPPAFPG